MPTPSSQRPPDRVRPPAPDLSQSDRAGHDLPISRRSLLGGVLPAAAGVAMASVGLAACSTDSGSRTALPARSGVLFDSDFTGSGFARYPTRAPDTIEEGVDFGLTTDRAFPDRKVAWFDSASKKTFGNNFPRVGIDPAPFVMPRAHGNRNDVYWLGLSVLYPSKSALTTSDGWCTLTTGGFGEPWNGPSPTVLAIVREEGSRRHVLQLGADSRLRVPFPFDTWMNIVMGYQFAYSGWVELYLSRGAGNTALQQIPLLGKPRLPLDTMRRGSNDAWYADGSKTPCSSGIGVYGSQPCRALYAVQRIARDQRGALPFG